MNDVPWNMPANDYGVFELEGFCIWINEDHQATLSLKNTGVVSHEFTHYVHSLSTADGIDDLLGLIFRVHAGMQRLEDAGVLASLPLAQWAETANCPPAIRKYVNLVRKRERAILDSWGTPVDSSPPVAAPTGGLYEVAGKLFIKACASSGAPVARLALMEGAALAKKCEALGNDSDLNVKRGDPDLAHYFAVHEACVTANPSLDPLATSALLCDISLCSPQPSVVFQKAVAVLQSLPPNSKVDDLATSLSSLYDQECRAHIESRRAQLERALTVLPAGHCSQTGPSWAGVVLENAVTAIRLRQDSPLSLIRPVYLGHALFDLASRIGSPVVITNDMRLTALADTSDGVTYARNAVRTLSYICNWLVHEHGPLQCPYAGCPDCPDIRRGPHCATNAALALVPSDDKPWCALLYSAHQLRVATLLRREVHRM